MAARKRSTARTAVLPARRGIPDVGRILPSGRSVLVGLLLLVLAVGAYVGARDTSVFAVRTLDVTGGTPALRDEVRAALGQTIGTSLLRVDGDTVARAVSPLPDVRTFTFDRAFPNTLRVVVHAEQPVLVLRVVPGSNSYLIAASGRVIQKLAHPRLSHLPRLWVKQAQPPVVVGERLGAAPAAAASALALLRGAPLPGGVHLVIAGRTELRLVLGGGLELRLGDGGDLRLKLAIARRILAQTGAAGSGGGYLDVSVPERPVLLTKSRLGG
ncbi:MAG TPA: FtsQ-type POTRA domain-containing protein [Gaiellaceae bacterium]|nr:FtsQ-type POTRA domain-containing protein [Gaiellaceae bacterium]